MANTFTCIYLHIVLGVKNRYCQLPYHELPRLHTYLRNAINARGHKAIAVGGIQNHLHILLSYSGKELISDLVKALKVNSTNFINENRMIPGRFAWQRGYGCFSCSYSQVDRVRGYIVNQEEHHRYHSMKEELMRILDGYGVSYDEKYLIEED